MLARDANALLAGPRSTLEANYPFLHQPPPLASLSSLLRICCEELVRYCVWPVSLVYAHLLTSVLMKIEMKDNCWFFCSLITSFLADQCPEDLNVNHLKNMNLARNVRRRIRIRYHISTGQPIDSLSVRDPFAFIPTQGRHIAHSMVNNSNLCFLLQKGKCLARKTPQQNSLCVSLGASNVLR